MTQVTVNVFIGTGAQVPTRYLIEAMKYQDILTAFIKNGIESGRILGINGEVIDYDGQITLREINYIIPEGPKRNIEIKSTSGQSYQVRYNERGMIRDLYNYIIAEGEPESGNIVFSGKMLEMDQPVEKYGINKGTNIYYLVPRTHIPVRVKKTINIRTPAEGEISVEIRLGETTANDVVRALNKTNTNMKLARVARGAFDVYIYKDEEMVTNPEVNERLYLVPEYESLYERYAAKLV